MSRLTRIGVAIEEDLLDQFDGMIARRSYASR
jgi:metal-responsive CopG/Arc/MetJ family transcriptional regulator